MAIAAALRCQCGALEGTARGLSPETTLRVVCYCDDCQAFAHHLGCHERVLDASGGTEILQMSPARIHIDRGTLAALALTPRGMTRWYSACCRDPVGNTFRTGRFPFVGLIRSILDLEPDALGPVLARVQVRFATGEVRGGDTYPQIPPRLVAKLFGRIAAGRLRGEHRASPFFDPETLAPVTAPSVLTETERGRLPGG